MPGQGGRLTVFISSRMGELRDPREALAKALKAQHIEAWVYEQHAGARPEPVTSTCAMEVEQADVYVGLFGIGYGKETVEEFRRARALGKPVFVYVRDKDARRDAELEEFLRHEVYDLRRGCTYAYFSTLENLSHQVAQDVMAWLVRTHREMTARIRGAKVSAEEIARLRAEVERFQAAVTIGLPQGTAADHLSHEMRAWFVTLGYSFEHQEHRTDEHFEWIIHIPGRRGYERIFVRGVSGEGGISDIRALREACHQKRVDEGWLVATRRISAAAREAAAQKAGCPIFCYTFDELLDEHADWTTYFERLEKEVKDRGVDVGYVPMACTKDEYDPVTHVKVGTSRYDAIDGYVDRWLDDPSKEHLSVLGEFGTGKTWFALHYAWRMLQRYGQAKERGLERPRVPLIIPLRDYPKAPSVEALFSEFFFRQHEIPLPGYSAFERLNRMGKLLLIFDGFDEMSSKVDRQKMINNFWELAKVVVPGSKALLTCRTEHFPQAQEGRNLLGAELQASTGMLVRDAPQFEVLELEKLSPLQIRAILSRKTDASTVEKVMGNPQLLDLARRPIMVDFILEALPDIESGKPVSLSKVYLYAVRRKIERDIRALRTFTCLADKLYFLCELSDEMLETNRMSLNYRLFPDRIRRLFGEDVREQKDLDHWHYDMMGQTMLIRDEDGDYTPAHRSLLEFFRAVRYAAHIGALGEEVLELARHQDGVDPSLRPEACTWSAWFSRRRNAAAHPLPRAPLLRFERQDFQDLLSSFGREPLTRTTKTLMEDLVEPEGLVALIEATRGLNFEAVGWSGGNAARLLGRAGGSLEGRDLRGAVLRGAELREVSLRGADLRGADLRNSYLEKVQLERAKLSGCDLRGAYVRHCWADGADFDDVQLDDQSILVFVGRWVEVLPKGATLLDAAFRLHSEVALQCTGGTINGREASVSTPLCHGDSVWIHRADEYRFERSWLGYVRTSSAMSSILKACRLQEATTATLLLAEVRRTCEQKGILRPHLVEDLMPLALRAVRPVDGRPEGEAHRVRHGPDSLETLQTSLRPLADELAEALSRIHDMVEGYVRQGFIVKTPRTAQRLGNVLRYPDILPHFGETQPDDLLVRILQGKISPAEVVAQSLEEDRRKRAEAEQRGELPLTSKRRGG